LGNKRRILLRLAGGLVVTLLATATGAADLRFIEVDRDTERNEYRLKSISWFDADATALYEVLTDYDQFLKFSSAIVESRNLAPDTEGRPEYFTRMEGCVLMFCKSFIRIGHLELEPKHWIEAYTDPERSDFLRAWERWELQPEDGGTLLIYEFEMIPAFWVPPVIGPYYMKRALRSGGARAVDRIEALARGEDPTPF
jgi:hypothetical protein